MSSSSVVQLKLKYWLKKPIHDDIIEAIYIQLSFEIYKGKLVLRFKVLQYIYMLN